jgi:hypothetical protein
MNERLLVNPCTSPSIEQSDNDEFIKRIVLWPLLLP